MNRQFNNAAFNQAAFIVAFTAALDKLEKSEATTKEELKSLSRSVLEATHITGDVVYINKVLQACTPIHRKVLVLYFRHFSGMHWDDVAGRFVGKSKKRYLASLQSALAFLDEPHNNVWTWAERNVQHEVKPFDKAALDKRVASIVKAATEANIPKGDILRSIIKAGFTQKDLFEILESEFDLEIDTPAETDTPAEINKPADEIAADLWDRIRRGNQQAR